MDARTLKRFLDLAIAIQQIPAPTFAEAARAAFVEERFRAEGLSDVHLDETGNVHSRLPGAGSAPPLVVSAHLDTVFPADTDLTVRREEDRIHGPGLGDNAVGVAGLFGLVWGLRQRDIQLPGDLLLVANVGEEGLGDLVGMRSVVERYEDEALAYLVLEGMALGNVFNQAVGVRRYRITARTAGGHSWVDFGATSAVHELAALVTALEALPLPETPRTTLNVGTFSGGTSVNTIAQRASLELDLRSEAAATLETLAETVCQTVDQAGRADLDFEIEQIGDRPAGQIEPDHPLIQLSVEALAAQNLEPRLNLGSTDASLPISRGYPAVCLGLTTGGGAHTLEEHIHVAPLNEGVAQILHVVSGAHRALGAA